MLKVGLIGYGKMGQMLNKLAQEYSFEVVSIVDPNNPEAPHDEITKETIGMCDVCIDFTAPSVAMDNIKKVVSLSVPLVVGTTGWYDQLAEVKSLVEKNQTALIYGSNYSIGVNILFKMVDYGSKLFNKIGSYDVAGFESHHNMKKDIPSGTGQTIAEIILENYDAKESITYQPGNREVKPEELHFTSLRCGSVNGDHKVFFDSLQDQLTIEHSAKNREGFARGALLAAQYIYNKKGTIDFVENFDSIIEGGTDGN